MASPRFLPILLVLPAALAGWLTPAQAQISAGGSTLERSLESRFHRWRSERGPGWRHFLSRETGWAEFLGGGTAEGSFAPLSESDLVRLAREFVEETAHLTGLEEPTLVSPRVLALPLSEIGTSDKRVVLFDQALAEVGVFDARVSVLFDDAGRVLSLQSTAMPGLWGTPTIALVGADEARVRATTLFEASSGLPATLVGDSELGIAQHLVDDRRHAALAWRVEVHWSETGFEPEGLVLRISALDGSLLDSRPAVHSCDISGTVQANVTTTTEPDTSSNPPLARPAPYMLVTSPAGEVTTDVDGHFNFVGASGNLNCTFAYIGDLADVQNDAGSEHVEVFTLSGTGNAVLLNAIPTEFVTAQGNAFREIAVLRDWIRAVNPSDDTADFQALANVNLDQSCNAFWNGSAVNFFRASGPCVNTAYSSVVAHEMGHWLNSLYGTGNESDGMGEGNADVFSLYLYDDPIVGRGFFGPGSAIRSGWNTRPFCGDCNPGCAGGVHADGEVWMGAAWKVRDHLNTTHGNAAGDAIADALFSGWMNVYDQRQIKSVIETQWLVLDDDNGNLDDGSPHYADIDAGFRAQSFPGIDLPEIIFAGVTELPDTNDELGPYVVQATVTPATAPSLSTVDLVYRVDDGPWTTVAMASLGGDDYGAQIPGQAGPADAEYYVTATDSAGASETFPRAGPAQPLSFFVGVVVLFFDDFEADGSNGWSHGVLPGGGVPHDDFHHGPLHCQGDDPSEAFSGTRVRGNDLGRPGWDGLYEADQYNYLRTPFIDCTAAVGTRLRFRRWLNVEHHVSDQAIVRVNGVDVWKSTGTGDIHDGAWVKVDLDISAAADGVDAVRIEFSLRSDDATEFGGWTIDDVSLVHTAYDCASPLNYGQAKPNSTGAVPTMGSAGVPSASLSNFEVQLTSGMPNQVAVLFSGDAPDNTPFFGGFRLVQPPLFREAIYALDFFGDGAVPITVTPSLIGATRYYQHWFRDPAHPDGTGIGLSDGLEVTFCE